MFERIISLLYSVIKIRRTPRLASPLGEKKATNSDVNNTDPAQNKITGATEKIKSEQVLVFGQHVIGKGRTVWVRQPNSTLED